MFAQATFFHPQRCNASCWSLPYMHLLCFRSLSSVPVTQFSPFSPFLYGVMMMTKVIEKQFYLEMQ